MSIFQLHMWLQEQVEVQEEMAGISRVSQLPKLIRALDNLPGLSSDIEDAVKRIGKKGLPILLRALQDGTAEGYRSDIRIHFVKLVGEIGGRDIVPELTAILRNGKMMETKKDIIEVLGEMGDESAVRELCRKLNQAALQEEAANALEKIGLEHVDLNGRVVALMVLGKKEEVRKLGEKAVPGLGKCLMNRGQETGEAAAEELCRMGNEEAVAALVRGLRTRNAEVCNSIAWSLGGIARKHPEYDWDDAIRGLGANLEIGNGDEKTLITNLGYMGKASIPIIINTTLKHGNIEIVERALVEISSVEGKNPGSVRWRISGRH